MLTTAAGGGPETGDQRRLVPAVDREFHPAEARILRRSLADQFPGAIPPSVVDQHDLAVVRDPSRADQPPKHCAKTLRCLGKDRLFVVARHDNRKLRRRLAIAREWGAAGPRNHLLQVVIHLLKVTREAAIYPSTCHMALEREAKRDEFSCVR